MSVERYDLIAFGAHPDDIEAIMGGTLSRLTAKGLHALIVDLSAGEPARYAARGVRASQAGLAARILGADRMTLEFQDRLIEDNIASRIEVARLIRLYRPRLIFTTLGSGVHPDHKAATDIVVNAVFYARLPKWDEIPEGKTLSETEPHEIDRLFFGHCRMEPPWATFDFAVDVTADYEKKLEALRAYEAVFRGDQSVLLDKYAAEDRYIGSLVGVRYAEAFRARSALLVDDPEVFCAARFG